MNLPNKLSIVRVACIPVIVILLYQQSNACRNIAGALFILASLTDFLDGYTGLWQPASRAQVALALPGLMVLSFQRPPDTPITGSNLSLGRPVSSGLPGEWL